MGFSKLFGRSKKDDQPLPQVPEWLSFFTPQQYAHFLKCIYNYFKGHNIQYSISDGVIKVDTDIFGGKELGINNLAKICYQEGDDNYQTSVDEHFETMIRIQKFNKEFDQIVNDFDKVKQYIGVRIHDAEYVIDEMKDFTITQEIAPGIIKMLIFDLPDSTMNVKPEQAKAWGKSIDELLEIGEKSMRINYGDYTHIDSTQIGGEHTVWIAEGGHFYVPNIIFELDQHPDLVGSQGALVIIPNRHLVITYPINNLDVISVVQIMKNLAVDFYQKGPGSISDRVYWYNNNQQFVEIPVRYEEGKVIVAPPQEFVDILNTLGKAN